MPAYRTSIALALSALLMGAMVTPVHADRQKARTSVNKTTNNNRNTTVNRNTNVNRNVNVDRDIDVDIDRDIDIDVDVDRRGCCYHNNGGAFVAGAIVGSAVTAAVIGTRVTVLPPACTVVMVNGLTYQQCGTVWYQPQFVGTSTTYVVINAPR